MEWMVDQLAVLHPKAADTVAACQHSDHLIHALADGCILIQLINTIRPNTIKRYNKPKLNMSKFKRLENLQKFTTACRVHLNLIPELIFASSDVEIGGFGGNGASNVISTLKHLMNESTARLETRPAPRVKPSLAEKRGYLDSEECFYLGDGDEVVELTLGELRELYESDDMGVKLVGSTQVSFGEDWRPLFKWLGACKNTEQVPLWKMKNGGPPPPTSSNPARPPPPKPNINQTETNAEKWYYEDDDRWATDKVAGPFTLEQMRDWFDMGKLDDQLVWFESSKGVAQMERTMASAVTALTVASVKIVPDDATKKLPSSIPPLAPAVPDKVPALSSRKTEAPASPAGTSSMEDDVVEYRRGLLGKFARSRKRHSGTKTQVPAMFRSKNWKKRFFILHGTNIEYYETRTKFIRRLARSV